GACRIPRDLAPRRTCSRAPCLTRRGIAGKWKPAVGKTMSPAHHPAIESWWSPGGLSLGLVAASILYLRGRHRLHSLSVHAISGWRAGSFFFGLILIRVALGSPLAMYDHELLTVHMVQHLLLMTFAPAL